MFFMWIIFLKKASAIVLIQSTIDSFNRNWCKQHLAFYRHRKSPWRLSAILILSIFFIFWLLIVSYFLLLRNFVVYLDKMGFCRILIWNFQVEGIIQFSDYTSLSLELDLYFICIKNKCTSLKIFTLHYIRYLLFIFAREMFQKILFSKVLTFLENNWLC